MTALYRLMSEEYDKTNILTISEIYRNADNTVIC